MGQFTRAALVLVVALSAIGCSRVGNGPETYQAGYNKGTFTEIYPRDLIGTYEATVKALTDLGMTIRKSDKNDRDGFLEATRPDDMLPVMIRLKSQTPESTVALIQVGQNGDEPYSRIIAKRIAARLKG